jgi:NTE family protein
MCRRAFWIALIGLFILPLTVQASDEEPSISVGVALGSGGAGGLAHIAMLEVFDDLGIQPDCMAGTSIGAVVGGLYASGMPAKEIRKVFEQFGGSSLDVLSGLVNGEVDLELGALVNIDIDNGGLIDASGFIEFLARHTDVRRFSELQIPLQVVATDFWSGDAVVIDEGDLFGAIKASMAVPGMFSPVPRGDALLIDGGTSNPLPWDLLDGCSDITVAVDVSSLRGEADDGEAALFDLLFSTFSIMQQSLITEKMRHREPDVFIKPDTSGVRLLHFNKVDMILEQAQPAARELREALLQHAGESPGA